MGDEGLLDDHAGGGDHREACGGVRGSSGWGRGAAVSGGAACWDNAMQ